MTEKYSNNFNNYFEKGEVQSFYYFMPDSTTDTGTARIIQFSLSL